MISSHRVRIKTDNSILKMPISILISSLCVSAFFILELIAIFWIGEQSLAFKAFGFLLATIAFGATLLENHIKISQFELLTFTLLLLSMLIGCAYNYNIEYTEIIWYFKYIFIIFVLLNNKIDKRFAVWSFYLFAVYVIALIFSGYSATNITIGVSQNAIGLYLLPLIILYHISGENEIKFSQKIISSLLYSFIGIWTGSRSAVVVGILLVLEAVLVDRNRFSKKAIIRIILSAIIILFLFMLIGSWTGAADWIELLASREKRPISQEPRYFIITEYISSCSDNLFDLLFGAKLGTTPLISFYDGNPHSMFIRLHANFGLVAFIVICGNIVGALKTYWRYNKTYLLMFSIILFRGAMDSIGFTGLFDIFVLYFIFYAKRLGKTKKETNYTKSSSK